MHPVRQLVAPSTVVTQLCFPEVVDQQNHGSVEAGPSFEFLLAKSHTVLSARGEPRTEHHPYKTDPGTHGNGQEVFHGQLSSPWHTIHARLQKPPKVPNP